ncbi:hypothetical protein AF280_06290, partial [Listeria monocytogenes]
LQQVASYDLVLVVYVDKYVKSDLCILLFFFFKRRTAYEFGFGLWASEIVIENGDKREGNF